MTGDNRNRVSSLKYACCINSWLINGGIIMGTLDLNAVVGLYVLIIPLFVLNFPQDQSLGVYFLILMAAPIYGFSLEENTKKTILSFTNCDNHTNEIAICQNTYSLELLPLTPLHITLLILHQFYFLHFIFQHLQFYSRNLFTYTHTIDPSFAQKAI